MTTSDSRLRRKDGMIEEMLDIIKNEYGWGRGENCCIVSPGWRCLIFVHEDLLDLAYKIITITQ